jgi:ABC-type transporter Mla MlaB component
MEFGLEDLTSTCEDLIVSNLDKNWALSLLKETVETLQQPSKSPNIDSQQVQRINDTVIAYLSDNYQSLKVHKTFLDLPVPTMTALLKSPNVIK